MDFTQVIIVGGGVAGLAAAKTLGSHVNYAIIEAQNYLGGRIRTVDAEGNLKVDLGAQYVHGDKKNIVYDMCKELDLLLSDDEDSDNDTIIATSDGQIINPELFEKAHDLWKRAREKAESNADSPDKSLPLSFGDYVPKEFEKRLLSSSSFSRDLIGPLLDYFMKSEMAETSCPILCDLNLIEYFAYKDLEGQYENELKNGGYRPFINHLKSFIPNDDRIHLNCEVTRVKFIEDDRKLLVEMINANDQRTRTMMCNHIIWTTSLGHLKSNFHRIFADEPALIEQKQNCIANLGFGIVNKVILIYEKAFWEKETRSILCLHTKKNGLFDMSDTLKQQLQDENVSQKMLQDIIDMLFLYDVLVSTDIPVLICWFVGPAAIMIESLSEQLVGQICHEAICSFLNVAQTQHPLSRVIKTAWHSNKYIGGSYSYASIQSTKQDRKELHASYSPDGIQRILFAGEATHEHYYSTVNAALETGIQAAKKILSIIK